MWKNDKRAYVHTYAQNNCALLFYKLNYFLFILGCTITSGEGTVIQLTLVQCTLSILKKKSNSTSISCRQAGAWQVNPNARDIRQEIQWMMFNGHLGNAGDRQTQGSIRITGAE